MFKNYFISSICCLYLFSSETLHANGIAIKLNSGILAGQANAGSAVIDDPLAIFTNPASTIQQCNMGVALQGTGLLPYTRFRGTTTDPLMPTTLQTIKSRQAGQNVLVPSGAVAGRIHDYVALGLVVSAPFGAKFDYGHHWGGNRYVIRSSLETVNITPTLAVKLHEAISIGGGLQVQHTSTLLSSQTASARPQAQALLQDARTYSRAKLHSWDTGWTAGILVQPICPLKIGFSYRSEIRTSAKGFVHFRNVPPLLAANPALHDSRTKAKVKLPNIFTLSGSYDLTSEWTALFDIIRTNWSSLQHIILSTPLNPQAQFIEQKWRNNWFFSAGVNYKYDLCWLWRAGIAYDQRASRSQFRVPGIPENDKVWAALGVTYSWDERLSTSLSYGHEFFKKQRINLREANPGNAGKGNLTGHIKENINLVSLQVNYQF